MTIDSASNFIFITFEKSPFKLSIFNGALLPDAIIPLRSIEIIVLFGLNII